jgi:hypothetical protein
MDGGIRRARFQAVSWVGSQSPVLAWLGVMVVLLILFAAGRQLMADTLPYVQHIDERTLMRGARRVLQEDGLNPRIYNYPSLPFYLAAGGVAGGAIKASSRGPDQITMKNLGRLEPPYYERMRLGAGARTLWLILALACIVAAAGCAHALAGPVAALLCSVVLGLTGIPTLSASEYISVDIPLALFCSLLLAQLACTFDSSSYRDRVWWPAALCGAAIACKYTGVVALGPALLALWLTKGPARLGRSVELVLLASLVFFLLCPRFLLDLPKFIDGISYESHHYGFKGHKRFTVAPGWGQLLAYLRDSANALGWTLLLASAVGFGASARKAPQLAATLLSFPVLWLTILCGAKVHFARNLLPVIVWLGIFAALGVCTLWGLVGSLWRRYSAAPRGLLVVRVAALILIAATLPWESIEQRHGHEIDSRVRFVRWTVQALHEDASLLIPSALPFAEEALRKNLQVQRIDLRDAEATKQAAQPGTYMLVPDWTTATGGVAQRVSELAPGMGALPQHRLIREFAGRPATPFLDLEMSINPSMRLVRFE